MNAVRILLIAGIVACFGCTPRSVIIDRVATPADQVVANEAIGALRSGDIERLTALAVPEARAQVPRSAAGMRAKLPSGREVRVTLAHAFWAKNLRTGEDRVTLVYQVRGARGQALVRLGLTHRNGQALIAQFQTARLPQPLEEQNAFRLAGKGLAHFATLLLALSAVALVLAALVTALRSPGLRWRWAWALGSLVGIGHFSINWATGVTSISPFFFQLFGAQATRTGPVGPWIVAWSVPLVAIVLLWRHAGTRAPPA
jgi:hypothetical protein